MIFITFVSDLMITIWMQVVSYHFDVTVTLTKCADSPEENILWYSKGKVLKYIFVYLVIKKQYNPTMKSSMCQ